jgi:Bacterial Ig-like domain (group 1)/Putative Ig domain
LEIGLSTSEKNIVSTYLRISLLFAIGCLGYLRGQSLILVSGNGQVVQSQFESSLLVVEAEDSSGNPVAGVAVNWKITTGAGTLVRPVTTTGANGQASVTFLATDVPGGESFFASTVTASAASGTVNFVVTTSSAMPPNGGAPPLVQLVSPPQSNLNLSGPSGGTIAGGVVVRVFAQSGPQTGDPVPNVSVQIMNNLDPTSPSPAACNGPGGVVLTNASGTATCNLVISGAPGSYQLTAVVGGYQDTTPFTLTVTPGVTCSFSLSSNSQTFGASGGSGTVNVITTSGCGWAASSNASFITVTSGASGTGNGVVGFTVASNTGATRTGTLTIAGQTYTVTQNAGIAGSLAINTPPDLAPGNVSSSYSVALSATGGTPPYTWSLSGSLPPGLALNASQGLISGTPTSAGTYGFSLTVRDSAGASQSQNFSIVVSPASTSGLTSSC